MSPIKDFKVVYQALNQEDTFSQGDTIVGTVTFTLKKDTKVKELLVKAKGEARVHWTEGTGDRRRSHNAHRRYFKLKECLVAENEKGTELRKGDHQYKFQFTIPQGNMPSSFKGFHGKVVYTLAAKMSRRCRVPSGVQKELNFVSRSGFHPGQVLAQSGSVDKKMGCFSDGEVQMSATINTNVCSPGDTVSAVGKIRNSSSKQMRAKFSLQQRIVYRATGSRNYSDLSLCKMVGETIAPNSEETVSCQLMVPPNVIPSVHHCDIISVDHYLKVYLDISFAIDPKVEFPLVIVPPGVAARQPMGPMGPGVPMGPMGPAGPYPAGGFGAPGYSDFAPPAFPNEPYPAPACPGAYGYPAPVPAQPYIPSGYNNQWPQPAPPFGYPVAPSFPVQHPHPAAPPVFQQEQEPPSYGSLFSPPPLNKS